ncbi:hypothetical protein AAVH_41924 [Aphelenchoides avenae]|nr:hypothetical protein AAVH_41924 [Aphelenchus avenae]
MPSPHQTLPQSSLYDDQYPLPQHQFFFGEQDYCNANIVEDPILEQIRRNEELAMQLSPVAKYLEQQRSRSQRKPQQPVRRKFSLAHGCLNPKKAPVHLFKPHKNNTSARRWYQEVAVKVLGRAKPRLMNAPQSNVQSSPHFDVSQYLA